MSLSERLRTAMKASGVSQAELARACHVKPPSVHGWLNEKAKFLRGENLLRASAILGVNDYWLATGKGEMLRSETQQEIVTMNYDAVMEAVIALMRSTDVEGRILIKNAAIDALTHYQRNRNDLARITATRPVRAPEIAVADKKQRSQSSS